MFSFEIKKNVQVQNARFDSDIYLKEFGVSISNQMTEVKGRVLTAPKIQYGGRVKILIFMTTVVLNKYSVK